MRRVLKYVLGFLGSMLVSSLAFAEDGSGVGAGGLIALGSGLAMGLAALGGGTGMGKAAGAALDGMARNPTSKDQVFVPMILVLALIEFQAIMGFIIAILWYNK